MTRLTRRVVCPFSLSGRSCPLWNAGHTTYADVGSQFIDHVPHLRMRGHHVRKDIMMSKSACTGWTYGRHHNVGVERAPAWCLR